MKPEVLIEMARDWANIKRRQACDILGSPEASELLADAKKFDLVVDTLKALTAQAAPAVPQGWKLVPVEPTQEMIDAMPPAEEIGYWAMYSAALDAAPAAPAAPSQPVTLTDEQRQQVFRDAEHRMMRDINLSWRNAVVAEVERAIAALREKGQA